MKSERATLLEHVFAALEQERVEYCVSRNHALVFEETSSDVDLLVNPEDLVRADGIVCTAARDCGFTCILRTRFSNLCLLFWKRPGEFLRIDFETELAWRIFPIQDARQILRTSIKSDGFRVPSKPGEATILISKCAWMGRVSERYGSRLAALLKEDRENVIPSSGIPKRWFESVEAKKAGHLRKQIILRTLVSPGLWSRALGYLIRDLTRFLKRFISPPGILVQTWAATPLNFKRLSELLEMAFPSAKSCVIRPETKFMDAFMTSFRAGMLFDEQTLGNPQDFRTGAFNGRWNPVVRSRNRFRCLVPPQGPALFIHDNSGHIKSHHLPSGDLEEQFVEFIGEHLTGCETKNDKIEGKFVVLVGLDGAGKTTFARAVAEDPETRHRFRGMRYFHWIPPLGGFQFPLPALRDTPRKKPQSGTVAKVASIIRLLKNVIAARISYHARLKPLVGQGHLVLIDRFVYNYWIDPTSLRYSGPQWCLSVAARLLPKPDLVVSLEADPEIILARKQELSLEEMKSMRHRIRSIPMDRASFRVLDASPPPPSMVRAFFQMLGPNGSSGEQPPHSTSDEI